MLGFFSQRSLYGMCRRRESTEQLGETERSVFVKAMLRLIDRGQYSKTPSMASTAANAASALAFVEPYVVLPLVVSRFYSALDTVSQLMHFESNLSSIL